LSPPRFFPTFSIPPHRLEPADSAAERLQIRLSHGVAEEGEAVGSSKLEMKGAERIEKICSDAEERREVSDISFSKTDTVLLCKTKNLHS
jgi:hypothetical protein